MILNKKNITYGVDTGYDKKTITVEQTSTIKLDNYYTGKDLHASLIVKTGATATVDLGTLAQGKYIKVENLGDQEYAGSVSVNEITLTTGKYVIFLNIFDQIIPVLDNLE